MSDKGSSRRSCVFCGSSDEKMSKEHVWSRWLRNQLPAEMLRQDFTYSYNDSERGDYLAVPDQAIFTQTVSGVCEPCNGGWMNRVENAVQPYIRGMLKGNRRELHAEGQEAIATWGVLKSLVAQRNFRQDTTIPSDHYRELYELHDAQQPPPATSVYTARAAWSQGQAKPGFFRLNGIERDRSDSGPEANGYLLTFSALDLVVQVIRVYGDERAEFNHSPRLAPSVRRIWPPTDSFTWPPGPALTADGVLALAGGDDAVNAGF